MIPFWYPGPIVIVPDKIEFHVFGILVGLAILVGSTIAQNRAMNRSLNAKVVADLGLWVVVTGFIVAHWFSVLAYFPERVFGDACITATDCLIGGEQFACGASGRCNNGDPIELLRIWTGISSFGGFFGAMLGILVWMRFSKIKIIPGYFELEGGKGKPVIKYLDAIAFGFVFAWIFGRLGCFSAHDHVGAITTSPLGIAFPDGWRGGVPGDPSVGPVGITPRFDLGFLESLWAVAVSAIFFAVRKRKDLRPGWFMAVMAVLYAPFRFYLDSLRAIDISGADKRYLAELIPPGITPGQFSAIVVLLLGIGMWFYGGKLMRDEEYMKRTDIQIPAFSSK
jgi:phosphatidylglycerol:prolipoprotein diacylglycerol transferase